MSENRYNVFNQIHKGLRNLLYSTAIDIQRTDFVAETAKGTIDKVLLVLELFEEHAHNEDTHLLPLIEKHDAALVAEFERDHEIDHKLSETLREHAAEWIKATNNNQRIALGQAIFYGFNEFVAFNLYHMNREENILLFTLWKHYTDQDILKAERAIVESIKLETLMLESQWMMRSLNNSEIVNWLSGLRLH
ncbi:MAG: hypothetical protein ACTHJ0_13945, partial [Flavipsychrobacter sp.]